MVYKAVNFSLPMMSYLTAPLTIAGLHRTARAWLAGLSLASAVVVTAGVSGATGWDEVLAVATGFLVAWAGAEVAAGAAFVPAGAD